MKSVGIIGAGFSGIATANTFKQYGFDVTVYEKESEVGGVWASSRCYPGLTTQNPKETYFLSDLKMPKSYPQWPEGKQVQSYISSYVDKQNLNENITFNAKVDKTYQDKEKKWVIEWLEINTGIKKKSTYDYLIVCNGIFSEPFIPDYKGSKEFIKQGGKILHTCQFNEKEDARGKNVIVVGFGKSSCDVSNAITDIAKSTTVVARQLIWKMPKKILGVLNFKYLMLTRMGENLTKYIELKGFPKFLHTIGNPIRKSMLNSLQAAITRQLRLRKTGLHPGNKLETIARANVSLATDGFFDKVENKVITVYKSEIKHLENGKAFLTNGEQIPVDIIVCGTGFKQEIPFMDPKVSKNIINQNGDFRLYKHQLPIGTHNLAFNGYNSSFYSQLSSEIGALWLAEYFTGGFTLPDRNALIEKTENKLAWSHERTSGKNSRGTNIIPFTLKHIDELFEDMKTNVSIITRFNQWNMPINPRSYNKVIHKKIKEFSKRRSANFHK